MALCGDERVQEGALIARQDRSGVYQKLVILPYSSMSSRLAIVAWNRIDELEQFDQQRLMRFYEAYHDRGPEDAP